MNEEHVATRLEVEGVVQGVGFRPFVYQLAKNLGLKGEVANTAGGVTIELEGPAGAISSFCRSLTEKSPPLADITSVAVHPGLQQGFKDFSIVLSRTDTKKSILISPDVSICDDCLRELFDPSDRRYRYPFINCTNCGPRYTIIDDIPYDRTNTAMKHFVMCARCQAEYDDPDNRRFHAQPNACPVCGPGLSLHNRNRQPVCDPDPIRKTAELIERGCILAIKGLGGFHLAADAENPQAVAKLRKRKRREEKPFAIMSLYQDRIRKYAWMDEEENKLLASSQRPIVLLRKKTPNPLCDEISPRNKYFGVMLPYTPLHYLLLDATRFTLALVMTSGNLSEEPIAIDNDEAFDRLGDIADYFLIHNRRIYLRSDDSIVRRSSGATRFLRRSRGYIPKPVFLKQDVPPVLACGAELKNTVCLTRRNRAFLSQHIGDLENLATYEFLEMTVEHMKRILDIDPEKVAFDLHPDYLSTQYARKLTGIEKIPVQHHHAHIVSCMAENRIDGPVIGLSFDGTGYGSDGHIWGGEILITETHRFERIAHLSYIPMPGGAAAVKEPWRMGVSYLYDTFGIGFFDLDLPLVKDADHEKIRVIREMIDRKINSPLTSSLGRLFDGVAAILGLRKKVHYEGQAAMELEMAADETTRDVYSYEWRSGNGYILLTAPIIQGVSSDVQKGVPVSVISRKFHNTVIRLFSDLCGVIRKDTGIDRTVLSGGVFQNTIILTELSLALEKKGFAVYTHKIVPTNDGGICLGQALVAASQGTGVS